MEKWEKKKRKHPPFSIKNSFGQSKNHLSFQNKKISLLRLPYICNYKSESQSTGRGNIIPSYNNTKGSRFSIKTNNGPPPATYFCGTTGGLGLAGGGGAYVLDENRLSGVNSVLKTKKPLIKTTLSSGLVKSTLTNNKVIFPKPNDSGSIISRESKSHPYVV